MIISKHKFGQLSRSIYLFKVPISAFLIEATRAVWHAKILTQQLFLPLFRKYSPDGEITPASQNEALLLLVQESMFDLEKKVREETQNTLIRLIDEMERKLTKEIQKEQDDRMENEA